MANANYIVLTELSGTIGWQEYSHGVLDKTATKFRYFYDGNTDPTGMCFEIKGQAAN